MNKTTNRQLNNEIWNGYIKEHQSSGMTVSAWCRERGLDPKKFSYYLNKAVRESAKSTQVQKQSAVLLGSITKEEQDHTSPLPMVSIHHRKRGLQIDIREGVTASTIEAVIKALKC